MTGTPLDVAHAVMAAALEDETTRLAFFERLIESELYILLKSDPNDDQVAPEIFETDDGLFVLVFDVEDRLTAFTETPAPYAALSGREVATLLAGQDIGLGLNLGVAPSSFLLPPDALNWLNEMLVARPQEIAATPREVWAPAGLPERLVQSLDIKLARAVGLASAAYLVGASYDDGRRGHLLALVGALPGTEPTFARAIQEALTFSGLAAGEIDVTFVAATDAVTAKFAKVGLRFDLPKPPAVAAPTPPGSDPERPPKLR